VAMRASGTSGACHSMIVFGEGVEGGGKVAEGNAWEVAFPGDAGWLLAGDRQPVNKVIASRNTVKARGRDDMDFSQV